MSELERRGWRTKAWRTRKGKSRGGKAISKTVLHELPTNVLYTGQVRYRGELYAGEQPALIDPETWQRVQALLVENGRVSRTDTRLRSEALLAGLLRCRPCGCAMTPSHVTKRGGRRYAYYVCTQAQKRGWDSCPSKSLPAAVIERYVLEQLRARADTATAAASNVDTLPAAERVRWVREWVERVEYDGAAGTIALTVRTTEAPTAADTAGMANEGESWQ